MTPHTVDRATPRVSRDVRGRKKVAELKAICGATLPSGKSCRRAAGRGTDHLGIGRCDRHGGDSPAGIKAAGVNAASILLRTPVMGSPVDMDPSSALLWCVAIAAGEVQYLSAKVAELDEEQLVGRPTTIRHEQGRGDRGYRDLHTREGGPKELHLLIKERQKATDRLARFSKMALDAGVAERQVRVAEAQAGMLAALITGVMADIGATKEQMTLLERVLPSRLLALEATPQVAVS